jgi:excisionase family DNA binding protein
MTSTADIVAAIAALDPSEAPAILSAGYALMAKAKPALTHSNGAPKLVDADGLAQAVSLPKSHVMTLARQGRIPSVKVGKYVRFNVAEVERALRCT